MSDPLSVPHPVGSALPAAILGDISNGKSDRTPGVPLSGKSGTKTPPLAINAVTPAPTQANEVSSPTELDDSFAPVASSNAATNANQHAIIGSDQSFQKLFDDYLTRLHSYNIRQRRTIYHQTLNGLTSVLSSLPAPRPDDANSAVDPEAAQNIVAQKAGMDPQKFRRLLLDVELFISDRLYAIGNPARSHFTRFDPKSSGIISNIQFRAALALAAVQVTDIELSGLVAKFDSEGGLQSVNYDDFFKYCGALRDQRPRTASQDAYPSVLLNRQPPTKAQVDSLVQIALQLEPLHVRLDRGLKVLRDNLYQKSSNFLSLFQSFQNENKQVAIEQLIPTMYKWGFPQGLCSEDEMKNAIIQMNKKNDGFLSYNEFCAFFLNESHIEAAAEDVTSFAEQSGLIEALVKLNHLNLRKIFKDLDSDADGLLTTQEVVKGLIDHCSLPAPIANDSQFGQWLETFCSKRKGQFGYADFLRFVNSRLSQSGLKTVNNNANHPTVAFANLNKAPMKIDDENTPAQVLDAIITKTRNSGISVEWVLKQLDANDDGFLEENEFLQGLNQLGIEITEKQNHQFFHALRACIVNAATAASSASAASTSAPPTDKPVIEISEFSRILVDPRRTSLQTNTRHTVGGESHVPLGSFSTAEPETPIKPSLRYIDTPLAKQNFDLMKQFDPVKDGELPAFKPGLRQVAAIGATSSVDLSFNADSAAKKEEEERTAAAAKGRIPPGGQSQIDFGNDHNAAPPRRGSQVQAGAGNFIAFDPNAPPAPLPRGKSSAGGGRSSIVFGDDSKDMFEASRKAAAAQVGNGAASTVGTGGQSHIDFGAAPEPHKPLTRVMAAPGGNSSIVLSHPEDNVVSKVNASRPQDKTNFVLAHHDTPANDDTSRRVLKQVGQSGATSSSVQISHSHVRRDEDLNQQGRARKSVDSTAAKSSLGGGGLGNDAAERVLNTFNESNRENKESVTGEAALDSVLVTKIVDAIYAHSQRLRHVFQEFNKSQSTSTLSKDNFLSGLQGIGVEIPTEQMDAIYKKYDADFDGQLSYSEFVRLMSCKAGE